LITQERLTHLKQLEAESIHILREVAAEFTNPVMMYSVGKDSSFMLHLAMKTFTTSKLLFPFLHVSTLWEFLQKESYE
jgi:sulfate adenylyltransferase subunit 2